MAQHSHRSLQWKSYGSSLIDCFLNWVQRASSKWSSHSAGLFMTFLPQSYFSFCDCRQCVKPNVSGDYSAGCQLHMVNLPWWEEVDRATSGIFQWNLLGEPLTRTHMHTDTHTPNGTNVVAILAGRSNGGSIVSTFLKITLWEAGRSEGRVNHTHTVWWSSYRREA